MKIRTAILELLELTTRPDRLTVREREIAFMSLLVDEVRLGVD